MNKLNVNVSSFLGIHVQCYLKDLSKILFQINNNILFLFYSHSTIWTGEMCVCVCVSLSTVTLLYPHHQLGTQNYVNLCFVLNSSFHLL